MYACCLDIHSYRNFYIFQLCHHLLNLIILLLMIFDIFHQNILHKFIKFIPDILSMPILQLIKDWIKFYIELLKFSILFIELFFKYLYLSKNLHHLCNTILIKIQLLCGLLNSKSNFVVLLCAFSLLSNNIIKYSSS